MKKSSTTPTGRRGRPLFAFTLALFSSLALPLFLFLPILPESPPDLQLFLGRFHPMLLHLPIGFLLAWAFLEVLNLLRPSLSLRPSCGILLWLSLLTLIPTTAAGILLAGSGGYDGSLLFRHQLLGSATLIACAWLLVLRSVTGIKQGDTRFSFRYHGLLLLTVVFLSLAGHLGGSLTHGSTYLTKYMPEELKSLLRLDPTEATSGATEDLAAQAPEVQTYHAEIKPLLDATCFGCHGEDKQKGGVRLDTLDPDMLAGNDAEGWHAALDMINSGEMPPEGKRNFSGEEREQVVDWMTDSVEKAVAIRRGTHKAVVRRLTRAQYSHALGDLLGLPIDFSKPLPEDGLSHMGFSNAGETLNTSPLHIEYYQRIARDALDKAIGPIEKPPVTHYALDFGQNVSKKTYARAAGFQSIDLPGAHFHTRVFDEAGNELADDAMAPSGRKTGEIKKNIMVDMRGSNDRSRWGMVTDGLVLYSPVPAQEVAPASWQGPSPNVKLLIRNDFPIEGDFRLRVTAANTDPIPSSPYFLVNRSGTSPMIEESTGTITAPGNAMRFPVAAFTNDMKNLEIERSKLVSQDLGNPSEIRAPFKVPADGLYQFDIVRGRVANEKDRRRVTLRFGPFSVRGHYNAKNDKEYTGDTVISMLGVGNLKAGEYKLSLKDNQFIDFQELVVSPLSGDHAVARAYAQDSKIRNEKAKEYADAQGSLQAFLGTRSDDGMDHKLFDHPKRILKPKEQSQELVFEGRLENLPVPVKDPSSKNPLANTLILGVYQDELVRSSLVTGPPVKIQRIEFEAPYLESWPPASYEDIFIPSEHKADKDRYTKEVLHHFLTRAFRKPAEAETLEFFYTFWKSIENESERYEDGVKEALIAILCSPEFLFIAEPEESKEAYALASRLSFFLWNSQPDDLLLELADSGTLAQQLNQQVERMIQDPRSQRFIDTFSREWLRLDRQEAISININKYPHYTRFVKDDLPEETRQFVGHVLRENLSIQNFLDSDFAMLNQNLSEFYGVPGVSGSHFRPVPLPANSRRGGLMTQASFLAGHSDGNHAHPIKRGVWLMSKLLGDEPPPPPPNVPELDSTNPDFEGLTVKEQLALHSEKESCIACHQKIDPWGVVFEQYDAVGRFLPKADANTTLQDGTALNGVAELKAYLAAQKQRDLCRSVSSHLLAYALGRDLSYLDEADVEQIVDAAMKNGSGFQDLIKLIVTHPLFSHIQGAQS